MRLIITFFLTIISLQMFSQNITLEINPGHTRAINGHSELNRLKYFNFCDKGTWFENKAANKGGDSYFLDERKVSFGRDLGLVYTEVNWGNSLIEDANRPGYSDTTYMMNSLFPSTYGASADYLQRFAPNLDVVNHDRHNAFPTWMSKYETSQSDGEWVPNNIEAATEISTNLLKYKYNDFYRPAYFELVNEPHWSFWGDQHFADWHTDLAHSVREKGINTKIGGPCLSVSYFYRDNYQRLYNFTQFIDNTDFELDFYSFHIYDYYQWNENQNEFTGSISTGLPTLGVLDAVANYTRINYGKTPKLVISEHGGYVSQGDEDAIVEDLGSQYFPGTGFDYELEKRSIINFIMVNSAITNTLTFMENPHLFYKTVPFILFETAGWDPTYYSSLMLPWDFTDTDNWAETKLIHYFQYFQNAQGRRVRMHCPDPDLQYAAFIAGDELNVLVNNMANKVEVLDFDLPAQYVAQEISITRLSRQDEFRPSLIEETISRLDNITIGGRGALALKIKLTEEVQEERFFNEISFYSNEVAEAFQGDRTFTVPMANVPPVEYAYMQIGVNRPVYTSKTINVTLNGTELTVPLENSANRFTRDDSYASTKIIHFDPSLLNSNNQVVVSFPDNQMGGIGSVVIKAGIEDYFVNVETPITQNTFNIFPNPGNNDFTIQLDKATVNQIQTISLYDSKGLLIDELDHDGTSAMIHWASNNKKAIPSGIYYVIIKDKNGQLTSKKWGKQ